MKNKGYFVVQSWMLELPLNLVETTIYAVIYGFSQDGETRYQGSLAYLAKMAKVSKDTARRALNKMVEAGFLIKTEKLVNGVTFNDYHCNMQAPLAICEYPPCNLQPHNNIDNDIDKSISININKSSKRFSKPTLEEVRAYCMERRNAVNPEAFLDYYESNGWKVGSNPMKDWKAAVRTWEKREKPAKPAAQPKQKESYFEHNNRLMAEVMGEDFKGFGGSGYGI